MASVADLQRDVTALEGRKRKLELAIEQLKSETAAKDSEAQEHAAEDDEATEEPPYDSARKYSMPKKLSLLAMVGELSEDDQFVYRLRDHRLRVVEEDYESHRAIAAHDAAGLVGVIVWKEKRARKGLDVDIKVLATRGADKDEATDLIVEMVGKLQRNSSGPPVEASIIGAVNPKNKEMLARWDGLGFVHNDEEMCTHRTLLPDLTT